MSQLSNIHRIRQALSALLVAALLLTGSVAVATPPALAAPAAQTQSSEVGGVLTGGQFAKIWLGLSTIDRGSNVTVLAEFDRPNPQNSGLGFFILTEDGLRAVLSGGDLRTNNLAAASRLSPQSPDNQLGAVVAGSGSGYTLVLFNDSATDASFTLRVTNGLISDDSNQVRDLRAAPTPATTEAEAPAAPATTPVPVAPAAVATPAPVATEAPAAATPAAATPAAVIADGKVTAQEMQGELNTQNEQHFLALEPSERNGTVTLTLSFDPQDNPELARRINFWVLTPDGFARYADPGNRTAPGQLALAAGSSEPGFAANQRRATFGITGFGPYTVIVYNTSNVPATYTLRADGGLLSDDSRQTLTAQRAGTPAAAAPAGDASAAPAAAAPAAAAAAPATGTGRTGEPGGTYTVQPGDTLSLIARDIYGQIGLWQAICTFNNLSNCNVIEVGQVLRLPTREQAAAGATAAATTPAPAATAAPAAPAATTPAPAAPAAAADATATPAAEEESAAAVNLVAALRAEGSFTKLVQALTAAGLAPTLEGAGPFTILAPTDAAFDALPAGTFDLLLANPTGQLTTLLLYHVLPNRVLSTDLANGMQATTQQGKAVTFEVDGGVKVNGANVSKADIIATNGVIHAIDAVILPPPD
mgnify:CR=1 FL=1